MHFVTMSHALEPRRAVVLSGLALVPRVAPIVHSFVHLWRASSVLGEELLEDYVSHIVEHANRDSFFRCALGWVACARLLKLTRSRASGPQQPQECPCFWNQVA